MGMESMMGGGAYGGLISGAMSLAGALMGGNQKGPDLKQTTLDPLTKGQDVFLEQGKNLPAVSQMIQEGNRLSTEMFKKNINRFAPDVEQTNRNISDNAAAMLAGEVPLGEGGGYNGRALTARDLGLTADDLMGRGASMAGASLEGARALNPFNHGVTETLLSPAALLSREDAHKYELDDLKNQQRLIRAKASSINPWMSALTSATSNIMGGMGGVGGGGGSGGGMMSMLGGLFGSQGGGG